MIHKTLLATILALVSTMVPALALTLPSNTMIYGQINQTIDTGHVSVGDQFTVNVISPYPNNDSRFQGAQIKGVVQSVQKAGQGRKPALQLSFYRIYVNGRWYSMTGLLQTDQKKYDSKILQQGAGALGGMLVGNALFKTLFGSSAGGPIGAVGGFLYGNNMQANFKIPGGSTVGVVLTQPLYV